MRNYFAIAFTCVYLILTVGVAKTTHYCMGRLSHSALFTLESRKCACSSAQKRLSPCCKDEHELIVIDNDQSQEEIVAANAPGFFEIASVYSEILFNPLAFIKEHAEEFSSDNSPPPRQSPF